MRRYWMGIAAALLLLLLSAPKALAVTDPDYTGPVDDYTGDPAAQDGDEENPAAQTENGVVIVYRGVSAYDTEKAVYYNYVGGDMSLFYISNIPNGMITLEPVSLEVPAGLTWTLYRNGAVLSDADIADITEPGSYSLSVVSTARGLSDTFSFFLVSEPTNLLNSFSIPKGFTLVSASRDGEELTAVGDELRMGTDGSYSVKIVCPNSGITGGFTVTVDHAAPTLLLEAVENGYAKGPVSLADAEPGSTLTVLLNGKLADVKSNLILTNSGEYSVRIQDAAGNITEYAFVILVYFNNYSITVFLVLIVLAVGLAVYLIRSRKNMRVR